MKEDNNKIKQYYYDKYVIKELPENFLAVQIEARIKRGYGADIINTAADNQEMLQSIQKGQKETLDIWIDYLMSKSSKYPRWFKQYALNEMVKLSIFNKTKCTFEKRKKNAVEPFIELNKEVLKSVYNTLAEEIGKVKEINDSLEQKLEEKECFKKLYEHYLIKDGYLKKFEETDGIWVKYEQGSDYKPMWELLRGKVGIFPSGEVNAKGSLSAEGDIYVYYTKDENGKYKEPRIVIGMQGKDTINGVAGVGENGKLEECMIPICEKKLNEFPDKDLFLKKRKDMKLLTEIENKVNNNIELTKEELRFLYEIDSPIIGFNYKVGFVYSKDPRIKEIRNKRNNKKDLAFLFDCEEENVGTNLSDFDKKKIIVFYGNFKNLTDELLIRYKEPGYIREDATFSWLQSEEGLDYLETRRDAIPFWTFLDIEVNVIFPYLEQVGCIKNTKNVENLRIVIGDVNVFYVESVSYLKNVQIITGNLYSHTAIGFSNLQYVGGNLSLEVKSVRSACGLEKLQNIGVNLYAPYLESAKGFRSLKKIGGNADLDSLTSVAGFGIPLTIWGDAHLESLTSNEGLENVHVHGKTYLGNLTSTKNLESSESNNEELESLQNGDHVKQKKLGQFIKKICTRMNGQNK